MLIYKFNNDQTNVSIQIKLLDNSFVSNWKDYVKRTSKRLPHLVWSFHPHHVTQQLVTNVNYKFFILNILKSFILLGKHYRIDYSAEIIELKSLLIDYSTLTQHHLNKWHRHFTSLAKLLNPFVSSTTFTDTPIDKIHHAIHELNNNSHLLETLTYPKLSRINKLVPNQMYYGLHAASTNHLEDNEAIWGTETVEYITEEFDFSIQSHNHNVWITDDILGKDHFKCWFEEDDPINDDIGGNTLMTPNITFDPNKVFTRTIEDPEFQKFVINSNKKLNRYPIGDIENIDEIDWNNITNLKLKSIELDGSILWKYEQP
jgi:hypothetical protein